MSAAVNVATTAKTVVLVVDDEPALLRALARLLRPADVDVLTAADADEALAVMATNAIDILLTDVDMPGKSGFELLAIVRREYPATIRMLLTGAPSIERAISAINDGEVARFLVKPIEGQKLRETIVGLRERVVQLRVEGEERLERTRVTAFLSWVSANFPDALAIRRDERGDVLVDPSAAKLVLVR